MPTLNSNGINLYYEIHGTSEPLVLINGLAYDLWMWHFRTHLTQLGFAAQHDPGDHHRQRNQMPLINTFANYGGETCTLTG